MKLKKRVLEQPMYPWWDLKLRYNFCVSRSLSFSEAYPNIHNFLNVLPDRTQPFHYFLVLDLACWAERFGEKKLHPLAVTWSAPLRLQAASISFEIFQVTNSKMVDQKYQYPKAWFFPPLVNIFKEDLAGTNF